MPSNRALLSLTLLSAALGSFLPTVALAQYGPAARIWVENDREYFRYGDRLRVNFSTSANSYVAVVHVDPEGYLDFVYPRSPWDDEFVRGGRVYSLDRAGWNDGLLVRGGSGIGYLYVIASPVPLDYGHFRGGRGGGWDWSYAGRRVSGDPFWALEQITRLLLPGWGNVPYAADFYTYHIGRHHRYPSYACADYGGAYGWGYSSGWTSYYGSCDRLDLFLRNNPYYFDSRRYRGDRRSFYRDYRDARSWDPRHGFKEDPERPVGRPGISVETPRRQPYDGPASTRELETPSTRPAQRIEDEGRAVSPPERVTPRPSSEPAPARPARAVEPQRDRPTPDARPSARPREAPARPSADRTRASSTTRAQPAPRSSTPTARSSAGSSGRASSTATPRSRRAD